MDLRQIRYFLKIAEAASFTAAAANVRLTQPALSRQMKALERDLGVELFLRNSKGAVLTETGRTLYAHAGAIVRRIEQVEAELRDRSAIPSGRVTIGITPAAGEVLIPPLIERYKAAYPAVDICVRQGFSASIEEWLSSHKVDLAVLPFLDQRQKGMVAFPLVRQTLFVVGRPGHPIFSRPSCSIGALAKLPLILPNRPHSVRTLLDRAAARQRMTLDVSVEVDGLTATKALVRRGLGYTVISYYPFTAEIEAGDLAAVPIGRPSLYWPLTLVTPDDGPLSNATRAMVALIKSQVRLLVLGKRWQHASLLWDGPD